MRVTGDTEGLGPCEALLYDDLMTYSVLGRAHPNALVSTEVFHFLILHDDGENDSML